MAAVYEETTHGVRIRVTPAYCDDRSEPEEDYFFWTYDVEITNLGQKAVQLQTRSWQITDANGHVEEVHGPGVVGLTPTILPGQSFSYTSGCPLRTAQGIMVGVYQMVD